jgi:hypothetical protein
MSSAPNDAVEEIGQLGYGDCVLWSRSVSRFEQMLLEKESQGRKWTVAVTEHACDQHVGLIVRSPRKD